MKDCDCFCVETVCLSLQVPTTQIQNSPSHTHSVLNTKGGQSSGCRTESQHKIGKEDTGARSRGKFGREEKDELRHGGDGQRASLRLLEGS